jgi:cullin 1
VERYLNTHTCTPLISRCEHVLIGEHSELMWDNFPNLLDNDKDEDLHRIYALLSRIPEGLEPLREKSQEHVRNAGLAAVSKLVGKRAADVDLLDLAEYVSTLLEVHGKNMETVTKNFHGDAGFFAGLDNACKEFVNRNAATESSSEKSAELLAKYADMLVRGNEKVVEVGGLEGASNHVVGVTCYLSALRLTYELQMVLFQVY